MRTAIVVTQNDAGMVARCLDALAGAVDELCWIDDASTDDTMAEVMRLLPSRFPRVLTRRNTLPRGAPYCFTLGARLASGDIIRLQHARGRLDRLPEAGGEYWISLAVAGKATNITDPGSIAEGSAVLLSRALLDAIGGVPHVPSCPLWALALEALWFCNPLLLRLANATPATPLEDEAQTARRALLRRVLRARPLNAALPGPQDGFAAFWDWATQSGMATPAQAMAFPYASGSRLLDIPAKG